tara:strand:+ start:290 stop:565 length:276 start_codon:yes stop_codon:yes gene_type:complete
MAERFNKDEATERAPQYRYMINLENKERRKAVRKQNQGGGKRVGKKGADGTFAQLSTPDCDWHTRWENPDIEWIREHARRTGNDQIVYTKK